MFLLPDHPKLHKINSIIQTSKISLPDLLSWFLPKWRFFQGTNTLLTTSIGWTHLRPQEVLFCWYSCVNYWLNPQIWVSRWWFHTFFISNPIWGRFPIWLIFFKGVETTNQVWANHVGVRTQFLWRVFGSLPIPSLPSAELPFFQILRLIGFVSPLEIKHPKNNAASPFHRTFQVPKMEEFWPI